MSLKFLAMIITCVTLSALSQLVMKMGMSSSQVQMALEGSSRTDVLWAVAGNIYVVLGLAMYVLGAGMWLLVLSGTELSVAYPFVGLGFILTMLFGGLFLQEPIGAIRVAGTLLITVGVVLVSRS